MVSLFAFHSARESVVRAKQPTCDSLRTTQRDDDDGGGKESDGGAERASSRPHLPRDVHRQRNRQEREAGVPQDCGAGDDACDECHLDSSSCASRAQSTTSASRRPSRTPVRVDVVPDGVGMERR